MAREGHTKPWNCDNAGLTVLETRTPLVSQLVGPSSCGRS